MAQAKQKLVEDAAFYRTDDELRLLTELTRALAAADPEAAAAAEREIAAWRAAEAGEVYRPVRGDRLAPDYEVPVEPFDPHRRLERIWGELSRDCRELLLAADRLVDLFDGRRVGYAASAVAVLIGSAMEREFWQRTAAWRSAYHKNDLLPWAEKGPDGAPRRFDGRWSSCDLICLVQHQLEAAGKPTGPLLSAHRVRQLRNQIHPGDGVAPPMAPERLNLLLRHAGLLATSRWPTFWHLLVQDVAEPRLGTAQPA